MKTLGMLAVLLFCGTAMAAPPLQHQDWWTGVANDGSYRAATTTNADQDGMGEFCYTTGQRHCEWRLWIAGFRCNQGATQVILVNSASGSAPVKTKCLVLADNSYVFQVQDWSIFEQTLLQGTEIGIAVPNTESGFRAMHFSLHGAREAASYIGGVIGDTTTVADHQRRDANL